MKLHEFIEVYYGVLRFVTCVVQLDGKSLKQCPIDVIVFKNLSVNHEHHFLLNATTLSGERNSSAYSWFIGKHFEPHYILLVFQQFTVLISGQFHVSLIDTIPPTATILSKQNYTNAERITIDINFSETCAGRGGFKCLNSSNCDVSNDLAQNTAFCYISCKFPSLCVLCVKCE